MPDKPTGFRATGERHRAFQGGLLVTGGFKPDDKAWAVPNLYVAAVDELLGAVRGLLIVGALDDFRGPSDVAGSVYKINAIRRHDERSCGGQIPGG